MTKKKDAAPPTVEPFVSNPPFVAAGDLIASAWGNAVVNAIGDIASVTGGSGTGSVANHLFDLKAADTTLTTNLNALDAQVGAIESLPAGSGPTVANKIYDLQQADVAHVNSINAVNVKADNAIRKLDGMEIRTGIVAVTTAGGVGTATFASAMSATPAVICQSNNDSDALYLAPWQPGTASPAGFQFTARKYAGDALYSGVVALVFIAAGGSVYNP